MVKLLKLLSDVLSTKALHRCPIRYDIHQESQIRLNLEWDLKWILSDRQGSNVLSWSLNIQIASTSVVEWTFQSTETSVITRLVSLIRWTPISTRQFFPLQQLLVHFAWYHYYKRPFLYISRFDRHWSVLKFSWAATVNQMENVRGNLMLV